MPPLLIRLLPGKSHIKRRVTRLLWPSAARTEARLGPFVT